MKKSILTPMLLAASFVGAQAAITVTNTDFRTRDDQRVQTLTGFDMTGGTKLVVTTATETGSAGPTPTVNSITFDGQNLLAIYSTNDGAQRITSYYLDAPTSSIGDIVITYSAGQTGGIAALAMSGAATGFADQSSSLGTNSGSFNTLAGDLVVGTFVTNASGTAIAPDSSSTNIYSVTNVNDTGGTNAASAYYTATGGADSFGFTGGGNRPVSGAVVFTEVVPEPSSTALLGLGGLALILRRRK